MGRARIIENVGEGLYRIQILRDTQALEDEREQLEEQLEAFTRKYLEALRTLQDIRRERDALRLSMERLVTLYANGLLAALPVLEPLDPIDPNTGLPWADNSAAFEADLFDAINAARSAAGVPALERSTPLDTALRAHCSGELASRRLPRVMAPGGMSPHDRAVDYGFFADPDVSVAMLVASGEADAAAVVAGWGDAVLAEEHTHAGVFFANAPFLYVYSVKLAAQSAVEVRIGRNPADEDIDTSTPDPVDPPRRDLPRELLDAGRELAESGNRVRAAERAVATMRAQRDAWQQRAAQILQLLADDEQIIHAWTIRWQILLPVGSIVRTFEVPGYFERGFQQTHTTTFGLRFNPGGSLPVQAYTYDWRPVNIVPNFTDIPESQVKDTRAMTDAAAYWNAAIEPGLLRWRPIFRYATITAIEGTGTERTHCDVVLDPATARGWDNLQIDTAEELTNVPISYPPCAGARMNVGDKVVVVWIDRDPTEPRSGDVFVVGYQREPIPSCTDGRQGWQEL